MGKKTLTWLIPERQVQISGRSEGSLHASFAQNGGSGEGFQRIFRKRRAFRWRPLVDGWKAQLTPLNLGALVSATVLALAPVPCPHPRSFL